MQQQNYKTQQSGMSLIELMVAVVLGLLIIGVVLGLFINSNKNYIQDSTYARMQESGRFAMQFITADIRMAGFWGRVTDTVAISNTGLTSNNDCGVTFNPANPIANTNSPSSGSAANAAHNCITAASFVANTDILVLKRVQGYEITDSMPASEHVNGKVYIRITGTSNAGVLIQSDGTATTAGSADWLFEPHIYYVRNKTVNGLQVPTLFRKSLGTALTMVDEEIAEGVENFQVQFGIDSDNDGDIDFYTAAPSVAQLTTAMTIRVNILVRARDLDPNSTYTNTKIYNLGEGNIGPFNDRFIRRVYTSTVPVRNIFQINLL